MSTEQHNAPSVDLADIRLAAVGVGNMGSAIVRAAVHAGVKPSHVTVTNSRPDSSERAADELGVAAAPLDEAIAQADVLVLGVKPYQLDDILTVVGPLLTEDVLVVSLAAGKELAALEAALPQNTAVVRCMPNTPVGVGEGVVHYMRGSCVDDRQDALAHALFDGSAVVLDLPETQVHALIAAAGSLPAFVFYAIEAMIDEAVRLGLPRNIASDAVIQTVRGSTGVLLKSGIHPAIARGNVCSPGGTTAQGVAALDQHSVRAGLAAAMDAAAEQSRRMARGD
ncbi:pyrroline-5-carboxylate reductase [Devriesea agamarum]|uniref:pyrroline-5-carboxylate reductase n=1 Tax=Devriesea agamarum TaxID=472569 RepID=UPI00071D5F86|nr:pyrroline-5-carboxylate reductase [Devriesea agamarum]